MMCDILPLDLSAFSFIILCSELFSFGFIFHMHYFICRPILCLFGAQLVYLSDADAFSLLAKLSFFFLLFDFVHIKERFTS